MSLYPDVKTFRYGATNFYFFGRAVMEEFLTSQEITEILEKFDTDLQATDGRKCPASITGGLVDYELKP